MNELTENIAKHVSFNIACHSGREAMLQVSSSKEKILSFKFWDKLIENDGKEMKWKWNHALKFLNDLALRFGE